MGTPMSSSGRLTAYDDDDYDDDDNDDDCDDETAKSKAMMAQWSCAVTSEPEDRGNASGKII